jgi:hypothetical protein
VALSWAVRAATALFGLALAISLAPRLQLAARPSDPVSALKLAGYRPGGLILQFLAAVLLTAAFAILGERIARLLAGYRWASISYCSALLLAPVALMHFGNLRHVLLLGVTAAAIVAVRRLDPRFTRGDAVLILTFLSCFIAFLDLDFGGTPVATMLRAMIAVFAMRLIVRDADAWTLSPLALLAQLVEVTPWISAAIALVILFGSPFLLRFTKIRVPRRLIYPIAVVLYPLAVIQIPAGINGVNFFEDSHNIAVAAEMVRGEKPYTDIIPTHGIISDGVVDYVAMELGVSSLRELLDIRLFAGTISALALYCLILAATGSIDVALLGTLLSFCLFSGSAVWLRPAGALFALAATVAGTRLRSRRWFMAAGALVVLGYLISVDFGLYSAVVAFFAAFRARMLRPFLIGFAAALAVVLAIFGVFGFALDFIRVNVFEIFGSHSVYFLRPLEIPECLRSPALVHTLANCVEPLAWVIALIASSIALARSPLRARRSDAPWLIGVWIVVGGASFVERGNFHFYPAVTPFFIACIFLMWRHARTVAIVLTIVLVLRAEPFRHLITVVPQVRYAKLPPLFEPAAARSIVLAQQFAKTLKPDETFVDFSNSALLFWILHRDCPLRQVEVANYQSEEAQREVIARIEHNPHIRAALIAFPGSIQHVDGIHTSERAPLVWHYLEQHFVPAFDHDGVVFWQRRP